MEEGTALCNSVSLNGLMKAVGDNFTMRFGEASLGHRVVEEKGGASSQEGLVCEIPRGRC